jgi:hypothetical protein
MAQTPGTPASSKPPLVLTAAILLIVVGALNLIGGIGLLSGYGGIGTFFAVIGLVIGAAGIFAGVKVLQLSEQGRMVGVIVAGVGAAFNIYWLIRGVTPQAIGLAISVFILYALMTSRPAFNQP